ncbi:MAG: hypothetical protein M3437_08035 [Chloroflexota bacterium]|nr:hypothetical protein [Chloroflexota bacterium]MDQ5864428.1 hypothetical protein [Chloroflexota bacterium]
MDPKSQKRNKKKPDSREDQEQTGYQGGTDEFEDVEGLDQIDEAPGQEDEEFEDADLDIDALGVQEPTEQLLAAREQLEQQLLMDVTEAAFAAESGTDNYGAENVVGVGIGEKMIDGQFTGDLSVIVYVVAKHPEREIASQFLVPQEVNGVPTDVVVTGELHALPYRGRYRPAPGGVSVGHFKSTAGTLGCLARRGNALYILSNNHVLANSNQANIGDRIVQPGPVDGGRVPADVIAKLSAFIPIKFNGQPNDVDCAIAQTSPGLVTRKNICMGTISASPLGCSLNLLVKKCGRTTQFTRGRVTDCSATVRINYGTAGVALFRDQIIVQSLTSASFSAPGDSGSLIVSSTGNRPVGLLFAGSSSHTIANPIRKVLSALGVTIVA